MNIIHFITCICLHGNGIVFQLWDCFCKDLIGSQTVQAGIISALFAGRQRIQQREVCLKEIMSMEPFSDHTDTNITAPFNRPQELYGREDVLQRLEEIFTSHRRAALTGVDGIG